jgi:hypothetical protein
MRYVRTVLCLHADILQQRNMLDTIM